MPAAATQPPAMSIGIHVAASGSLPAPPTAPLEAGQRLHERVVAGHAGPRAGRAEGAGVAVDGAWVEAGDGGLVDAQPLGHADPEVVQHDVGPPDQPLDDRAAASGAEVEGQAALAPLAGGHGVGGGRASPRPRGGSTLMTSAPRSARTWAASGPATNAEKSTTRTPSSRPCVGRPPRRRRRREASSGSGHRRDGDGRAHEHVAVPAPSASTARPIVGQVRVGQRLARAPAPARRRRRRPAAARSTSSAGSRAKNAFQRCGPLAERAR